MGASQSKDNNAETKSEKNAEKNLPDVINYLASNYILEQNFQDMVNLRDTNYCNDLVIITSDVIGEYLNDQQVKYLSQRTKNGAVVNEIAEDSILWVKENNFKNLDVKHKVPKKRLCIGIAKYYVKIAHLFGAIVTTINPTYTYKENITGKKITVSLQNKKLIPNYATPKLNRINICSERINALINGKDLKSSNDIIIEPNFCNMNVRKDGKTVKSITDEPGIPELELLYRDVYDYDEGKFKSMSTSMKTQYDKDVEIFYKTFTGNSDKPESVKTFSDIKLKDFASSEGCKKGSVYRQPYEGTRDQELFKKYADHIQMMITNAQNNQNELLSILDQMFAWNRNRSDDTKQIIIAPDLNEEKLDKLIAEARNIIIKCYTTCESDFITGLEIFEGIVEKQIMDVTKSQIDILEKTIHSTLSEGPASEKTEHDEPEEETPEEEKPDDKTTEGEKPVDKTTEGENPDDKTTEGEKPVDKTTDEPANEPVNEPVNEPEEENSEGKTTDESRTPVDKQPNEHTTETFINPPIKSDIVKKSESIEPTVPTDSTTIVNTDDLIQNQSEEPVDRSQFYANERMNTSQFQ